MGPALIPAPQVIGCAQRAGPKVALPTSSLHPRPPECLTWGTTALGLRQRGGHSLPPALSQSSHQVVAGSCVLGHTEDQAQSTLHLLEGQTWGPLPPSHRLCNKGLPPCPTAPIQNQPSKEVRQNRPPPPACYPARAR